MTQFTSIRCALAHYKQNNERKQTIISERMMCYGVNDHNKR